MPEVRVARTRYRQNDSIAPPPARRDLVPMWRMVAVLLLLAGPAWAQAPAPQAAEFNQLFAALKAAPDAEGTAVLESHLRLLWLRQATPATRLLIDRGLREMQASEQKDARQDFDDALALQPDLVEAWYLRAEADQALGDDRAAVRDLGEVLKREPRHFAAWDALSRIAEAEGKWKSALAAWQKVMAIAPQTQGGAERLKDLRRRALGENT